MRAPHGRAQSLREGLSAQLWRLWSADSLRQTASSRQLSGQPQLLRASCLRSHIFLGGPRSVTEQGGEEGQPLQPTQDTTDWQPVGGGSPNLQAAQLLPLPKYASSPSLLQVRLLVSILPPKLHLHTSA